MSKYKFTFTTRLGSREVYPVNTKQFSKSWDEKDNRAELLEKINGNIMLAGEDFNWLFQLEKTQFREEYVKVLIEKRCGQNLLRFFSGNIYLNSGEWDEERCTVTLSFSENEKELEWETNKGKEIDLFELVGTRKTVNSNVGDIETALFVGQTETIDGGFNSFPGLPDPSSKGWVTRNYISLMQVFPTVYYTYSVEFVREVYNGVGVPAGLWIYDADVNKYVRKPNIFNITKINPNEGGGLSYWGTVFNGSFDNGIDFKEGFVAIMQAAAPSLKIKSDFFQINPSLETITNYATGLTSKILNLLIFQKSDIKRPIDSNNAQKLKIIPNDFVEDICNIWQLEFKITETGIFEIEHVSYRKRLLGMDTTASPLNRMRKRWSYDNDKLPDKELFLAMEYGTGDFAGLPIIYTGANTGKGASKDITYQLKRITTDVSYCLANSEPDSKVSDNGIVIIAGDGNGNILNEDPILTGGNVLNNTLAWSQLLRDYWKYRRPKKFFNMNGQDTQAISVKPTKLEKDIKIKFCCGMVFDPDKLVKSHIGNNGEVRDAKYNPNTEILTLDLLFPSEDNLIYITPPVVTNDNVLTGVDTPVIVNALSNDTSQGGFNLNSLVININPENGIAEILPDKTIRYIPNAGFAGTDYVGYKISDIYNQISNQGYIIVEVLF